MKYINKKLTIEKINFQKIENKFGTPSYCYSYSKLRENIINFKKSFKSFSPLICFAVKSNTNVNIIKQIWSLYNLSYLCSTIFQNLLLILFILSL